MALAVPLLRGGYTLYIGTEALIWGIAAAGLGALVGYGGLVSLGHAAFFGLGAYTTALLTLRTAAPWGLAVALAVMAGCAYAALTGPLVLRSHGIFFVMLTLAFGQLLYAGAEQWVSLTRGSDGISGIAKPGLFEEPRIAYVAIAAVALGVLGVMGRAMRSPFGRVLDAVRQDEAKARALGYPAFLYRYAAFIGSAGVTALAGALYAYHRAFVSPEDLRWTTSGVLLVMVLLGGARATWGWLVGAAAYVLLRDWISSITQQWQLIVGALLILGVLAGRQGLWNLVEGWVVGAGGAAEGARGGPKVRWRAGPQPGLPGGGAGGEGRDHRAERGGQEHAVSDHQRRAAADAGASLPR